MPVFFITPEAKQMSRNEGETMLPQAIMQQPFKHEPLASDYLQINNNTTTHIAMHSR